MKKILLLLPFILLSSCTKSPVTPVEEDLISLFNETSKLYIESLDDKHSCLLKTYHHKKFNDVPFVALDEFCESFDITDIREKKKYEIVDNKFVVSGLNGGSITFDAKEDIVTSSSDVMLIYDKVRYVNNGIPFDFYVTRKGCDFAKGSSKTTYLTPGSERVYDLKKYNFDIVYEDNKYYAPFMVLSYIFYGFFSTTHMYNGKNFFDCDCLDGEYNTAPFCYSSKGDFLLDRTKGSLGAVLFKKVEPKLENEAYRFENIIESSKQLTVFSLLNDGTGSLKTYDANNQEIDEGALTKITYTLNENKTELEMKYFSVLDMEDTEPISDVHTLRINLDETYFNKKTRSKEVAEATYQELRFAFYELYGHTRNDAVRDFDNFIKDKEYKDDLLSLDVEKYDDAMAKLLLQGVDDAHTTIEYPSIYTEPTFANANKYSLKYEGERRSFISSSLIANANKRKEAGITDNLDIVNKTAFIAFDKFAYDDDIKAFDEYKDTDPSDYAEKPMHLFASAFNKIKENENVKNVVIDLTANGGGIVASLSYILAYLTKDPSIVVNLELDNSFIDYHYEVDLNFDGTFASDEDTFEGKYNFYVLISSSSFSCANHLASIVHNIGCAKVIGERSAGGSCIISCLTNSTGYLYHSSSLSTALVKENDKYVSNDLGVEPDIKLDSQYFYNHAYIDEFLLNQ